MNKSLVKEEACEIEFGFNQSLVAMRDVVVVQPECVRVDPVNYAKEKLLIYITNVSDSRQYFAFTCTTPENFEFLFCPNHVDPGHTAIMIVKVLSTDFRRLDEDTYFFVYHSRQEQQKDIFNKFQDYFPIRVKVRSEAEHQPPITWLPGPRSKAPERKERQIAAMFQRLSASPIECPNSTNDVGSQLSEVKKE
ncbi:hypothetical protein M3Y94_00686000 [Aphelenchoides besseyi]|nr:hypothetical protein M3Y94_00686000 [Aphelenchoides besseyi]KAI6231475.1 hypothetical protein M3Y95_00385700 [Aphelenchoides besseyi]